MLFKKCSIQSELDNLEKQPQTTEVIFHKAEYKVLLLKRMTEVKIRGKTGQAAGSVQGMDVYCGLEAKYKLNNTMCMQKLETHFIFSALVISQMEY